MPDTLTQSPAPEGVESDLLGSTKSFTRPVINAFKKVRQFFHDIAEENRIARLEECRTLFKTARSELAQMPPSAASSLNYPFIRTIEDMGAYVIENGPERDRAALRQTLRELLDRRPASTT